MIERKKILLLGYSNEFQQESPTPQQEIQGESLTSYCLNDKCPVPPKAANHVDCSGPPTIRNITVLSKLRTRIA